MIRSKCKLRTVRLDRYGYSRIWIKTLAGWKSVLAHRQAWIDSQGAIPKGMLVLHDCDVRNCVNVKHLKLGTNADNANDCVKRNRKPHGSQILNAKLTEEKVVQIRKRIAKGDKSEHIAADYGVSGGLIGHIKFGRKWVRI